MLDQKDQHNAVSEATVNAVAVMCVMVGLCFFFMVVEAIIVMRPPGTQYSEVLYNIHFQIFLKLNSQYPHHGLLNWSYFFFET